MIDCPMSCEQDFTNIIDVNKVKYQYNKFIKIKSYHQDGFKNVSLIATYNSEITFMDTYISILGAKQRVDVSGEVMNFLYFTDESCLEKLHIAFTKQSPFKTANKI